MIGQVSSKMVSGPLHDRSDFLTAVMVNERRVFTPERDSGPLSQYAERIAKFDFFTQLHKTNRIPACATRPTFENLLGRTNRHGGIAIRVKRT